MPAEATATERTRAERRAGDREPFVLGAILIAAALPPARGWIADHPLVGELYHLPAPALQRIREILPILAGGGFVAVARLPPGRARGWLALGLGLAATVVLLPGHVSTFPAMALLGAAFAALYAGHRARILMPESRTAAYTAGVGAGVAVVAVGLNAFGGAGPTLFTTVTGGPGQEPLALLHFAPLLLLLESAVCAGIAVRRRAAATWSLLGRRMLFAAVFALFVVHGVGYAAETRTIAEAATLLAGEALLLLGLLLPPAVGLAESLRFVAPGTEGGRRED